MSLTDDIYRELMDELGKDLDYTYFQEKYRNSKGPFYNAFGRFTRDMEPKVRELGGVQAKLDAAGLTLDQLYRQIKEAEAQLKGLQTQIETKKMEAENWQAKEETFKRKHDDLKETIEAVVALRAKNIKPSQIVAWHQILTRFQTVEQFDQCLAQYSNVTKLLNVKKEETENWEMRLAKAQSRVEILEKERVKIEGAIDALKEAGVKQLKAMTGEAKKQMKALAIAEKTEIREIGQEVRNEFNDFFNQLDASVKKVFDMGQEFEGRKRELQKYEGVKDVLESHAASSEEEEKE